MKRLRYFINNNIERFLAAFFPKVLLSIRFKKRMGKRLNLQHPVDIDEKIHWLKYYSDTSLWTLCADKYRVRDFVTQRGLSDILIPLIGHWDRVDDVDWESLPNCFVMKTNHGSGDVLICKDKQQIDKEKVLNQFRKYLATDFSQVQDEPHYRGIAPCIIAEEYLDSQRQQVVSSSMVDYKIWSFDGKPAYIWACTNRTSHSTVVSLYDLDWNFLPQYSVSNDHYILADHPIVRPKSLEKMIEVAAVLSKGFPEVRVDLYEMDGKVYFGEMTFTSNGGFNNFFTEEFRIMLGNLCHLPARKQ